MNKKNDRWMYIWLTEHRHGKSIPNSKTDVILQFMYLEDIIKEKPYTKQNGCYIPNTVRMSSSPSASTDTSITVAIMGFVEDPHKTNNLHILRDIYVRLESKEVENVEDWQFCIASFFSFLFSCRISSGMRFDMEDEWKHVTRKYAPYYRTGTPEEIDWASRKYPLCYKTITPIVSDIILSWANYYFSHRAFSWGIQKYLQTVDHENKMAVDLAVALICETFQQCSEDGKAPEDAMKEWTKILTQAIPSIDAPLLSQVRNEAHRYYQNSKHFHVRDKWNRNKISDDKLVAQAYFLKRFFQLKILHIILKDNLEVFHELYPHLVEDANNVIKQAYGSKVFN